MGLEELRAASATPDQLLARSGPSPDDLELAMTLAANGPGARPAGPPADADLAGTPEEMAERVRRYAALGIRHVLLQPQPRSSPAAVSKAIELFAREGRPRLAG